ncbi:transcription elongation factor [Bradyrhizobium sp. USDA 3256]
MRPTKALLVLSFIASAAMILPYDAQARRGGAGARSAHFHGGGMRPGWHGGGTRWHAGGWHGGGARWAGGRYYRGGGYYGGGWGAGAAAAGLATGAAIGAATAYNSCYQTRNVWNGYAYVQQSVRVC